MSVVLTVNGVPYAYPETGDTNWGNAATQWAVAVTQGMLQKSGGTFTLTAEANFGASFGLKAVYLKSVTANPAAAGFIRLAKTDSLSWRNNGNTADLALAIDGSDVLTFAGSQFTTDASSTRYVVSSPAVDQTLLYTSGRRQDYTPSVDIVANLPSSSIVAGDTFFIENSSSTKVITVKSSDGDTFCLMIPKSWIQVTAKQNTPTDKTHWKTMEAGGGFTTFTIPSSSGFGTITNATRSMIKREGPSAVIIGYFTAGTVNGSLAEMGLPYGITILSTLSSLIPVSGMFRAATGSIVIASASSASLNFWSETANGITANAGTNITSTGEDVGFVATVPIDGWEIG